MSPGLLAGFATLLLAAPNPFDAGVEAYRKGNLEAAAKYFAAAGEDPVANYDAGLAWLERGDIDKAIPAFEVAAVRGQGPVRAAARMNLALSHVKRGDLVRAQKPKQESREEAMQRLGSAARSYRTALALFRRVPPPSPDAGLGAKAAKIRLLASLDELQKLAREEHRAQEKKALSHPPALLLRMLGEERDRRRAVTRTETLPRRHRRLPARRIRAEEYEARRLLAKLAARWNAPPQGTKAAPPPPSAKAAAKAIARAEKAMGEAEGRLDAVDLEAAAGAQTQAVAALTEAALALPAPLASIVGKLLEDQSSLLALTKAQDPALVPAEEGEMLPFLKALANLPEPPPAATHAPGGPPPLDAKAVARIRVLAKAAQAEARKAAALLSGGNRKDSLPGQRAVLSKLRKISDLLPKPPEPFLERLRRLLATQQGAKKSIAALPGLADDARKQEEGALAARQTAHGREAGKIAKDLSAAPGKKEKKAAGEVRKAERAIHGSSEALRRDRMDAAGESVERGSKAIQAAIAILSGKQAGGKQASSGQKPKPESSRRSKTKKQRDSRQLTPREARRQMEEMDRDRREQERKLLPGGGGARVDKDW